MLSNIDEAICVETYFSTKSFSQTRRLPIKKLGWDHMKSRLAPNNATISRWVKEFRDGRLFHRKQGCGRPRRARSVESIRQAERSVWEERSVRAVACSPSGRSSRPCADSPVQCRPVQSSPASPECRYPARVVPAGWRNSSYRCCITSLAPAALPWQGHQPEGRGSVGAALARPESARLLPLGLSQKSGL